MVGLAVHVFFVNSFSHALSTEIDLIEKRIRVNYNYNTVVVRIIEMSQSFVTMNYYDANCDVIQKH